MNLRRQAAGQQVALSYGKLERYLRNARQSGCQHSIVIQHSLLMAAQTTDGGQQAACGCVLAGVRVVLADDVSKLSSQPLAELNAPLVEGIDAPDDALDKYFVLVQCDELP